MAFKAKGLIVWKQSNWSKKLSPQLANVWSDGRQFQCFDQELSHLTTTVVLEYDCIFYWYPESSLMYKGVFNNQRENTDNEMPGEVLNDNHEVKGSLFYFVELFSLWTNIHWNSELSLIETIIPDSQDNNHQIWVAATANQEQELTYLGTWEQREHCDDFRLHENDLYLRNSTIAQSNRYCSSLISVQ